MTALLVGTLLALGALAYVLAPLFTNVAKPADSVGATYEGVCATCGPRPEPDARYCSSCGRFLGGPCPRCGAAMDQPGARFCSACGHHVV